MALLRPRFSLITALLLTTIVGMAIVIAQLWREVGPLREELVILRNETGRLSIDDYSKLHAIEVRIDDDLTWKWRVWVPEGETVTVHSQWGQVPRSGVPVAGASLSLGAGEHWITLSARLEAEGKYWQEWLATAEDRVGDIIKPNAHWFDWQNTISQSSGIGSRTYVAEVDNHVVVLKRHQVAQGPSTTELDEIAGPTPGFIIWLERR